jgi:hypothetical protein
MPVFFNELTNSYSRCKELSLDVSTDIYYNYIDITYKVLNINSLDMQIIHLNIHFSIQLINLQKKLK